MNTLKPCPFCGCAMSIENGEVMAKLLGDHDGECPLAWSGAKIEAASGDSWIADVWNRRAQPVAAIPEATGLRTVEPVPQGWEVSHPEPWDALTPEAQQAGRIHVKRLAPPFCDKDNMRGWSGPTLEAALAKACTALGLPAIPEATGKQFATFEDWLRSDIPKPTALTPDGKLWEYARHAFNAGRAAIPEAGQSVPKLTYERICEIASESGDGLGMLAPFKFAVGIESAVIASMSADAGKGGA